MAQGNHPGTPEDPVIASSQGTRLATGLIGQGESGKELSFWRGTEGSNPSPSTGESVRTWVSGATRSWGFPTL
jgi:hypothetical protein